MDQELKQRLIGAVVVTALAAIFIPMLFDDPVDDKSQQVSELAIPPTPAASTGDSALDHVPKSSSEVLNAKNADQDLAEPEEEPMQPIEGPDVDDELGVEAKRANTAKSKGSVADKAKSKPVAVEESIEVIPEEVDAETEAKIDAEVERLRPKLPSKTAKPGQEAAAHEVSPATKPVTGGQKPLVVAQVPPVKKMAADANKIKTALKPQTIELPSDTELFPSKKPSTPAADMVNKSAAVSKPVSPEAAKKPMEANKMPAAKPKAEAKRWYIQVGSFGKKENAMSLFDSLRKDGFPVSLDTVQGEKSTLYRLKIGPELEGKRAADMKAKLDKQNIKAILIAE